MSKKDQKSTESTDKRATRGLPKVYPNNASKAHPFLVSWRHQGKRERYYFKTEEEAIEKRNALIKTIHVEGAEGVQFGAVARAEYAACSKILAPLGVSLIEAVQTYARSLKSNAASKKWTEAVFDLKESLEMANRRPKTITNTETRLRMFAEFIEPETLADFNQDNCERFLASGNWKPSTVAALRAALSKLGNHSVMRKWIRENPVENIGSPTLDPGHPEVYTIDEANRLLTVAAHQWSELRTQKKIPGQKQKREFDQGRILGRMALLLLLGLRPTEIDSLKPSDFRKDGVRVGTGKLRGRRSVRFVLYTPSFLAWWNVSTKETCPSNFRKLYEAAKEAANIEKHGTKIERHTRISALLATSEDENYTARQAGNSPDVIYNNYFQLLDKAEAAQLGAYCPLDSVRPSKPNT